MIDRVLDFWPVRHVILLVCWLEDRARTYGYVSGGY